MVNRRRLLQASVAALPGIGPVYGAVSAVSAGLSPEQAAAHALNRLGFGPRPGDLASVARDPRAWIAQQLQPHTLALPDGLTMKLQEAQIVEADPIATVREFNGLVQQNLLPGNAAQRAEAGDGQPAMAQQQNLPPQPTALGLFVRGHQRPALESRLFRALESPRQLEEAMVDFWFNHFNVYQNKNYLRVLVGHYEHYAIRPFALGRFRDLLGATAHHPAMLYYLDNWASAGPQPGNGSRGLNENYARELMELHTLGVDGGYAQQDVTQLARMLTGWSLVPLRPRMGAAAPAVQMMPPGRSDTMPGFWFNPRQHDMGDKTWLGYRVAQQAKAEGDFALDVLARHPATARHIGFKLAQYFVSDQPDPALVEHLAQVFLAEDGQTVPVLRALFSSPAFWAPENSASKFKTPYHYVLSALRAGGFTLANGQPLVGHLAAQGMPLFGCQTPDGYHNTEVAWLNPDALTKRLNFATQVASGRLAQASLTGGVPVDQLLEQLGPLVTPATRSLAMQNRDNPSVALALVLAGPGMMRR
ncbi:MAG: hypothetical protein RLZZ401_1011 [Pseudomonadota bacterium]|jgi:uncharacterized protein (DUF1800 family)